MLILEDLWIEAGAVCVEMELATLDRVDRLGGASWKRM